MKALSGSSSPVPETVKSELSALEGEHDRIYGDLLREQLDGLGEQDA